MKQEYDLLRHAIAEVRKRIRELPLQEQSSRTERRVEMHREMVQLMTRQRRCYAKCFFCETYAFKCDETTLPEGWQLLELPQHEHDELVYHPFEVCPEGHAREIEAHTDLHLNRWNK